MGKGRPGGNPEITKYSFTTDREYPLVESMTLKMDAPTKAALKSGRLPHWQEIARVAIAKALAEEENLKSA
jgi:hypothetical protein